MTLSCLTICKCVSHVALRRIHVHGRQPVVSPQRTDQYSAHVLWQTALPGKVESQVTGLTPYNGSIATITRQLHLTSKRSMPPPRVRSQPHGAVRFSPLPPPGAHKLPNKPLQNHPRTWHACWQNPRPAATGALYVLPHPRTCLSLAPAAASSIRHAASGHRR